MNSFSILKIKTLTVAVALALAVFAGIAVFSTYYISQQMAAVGQSWREFRSGPTKKVAILSDLRNALGYGGMIHNFKNFILRKDRIYVLKTSLDILKVTALLTAYQNIGLNAREQAAIDVLDSRLTKYESAIGTAEMMARVGRSSKQIDAAVRINDDLALAVMLALVDELEKAHIEEGDRIERIVTEANQTSKIIFIVSFILAFVSIGFTLWFMYRRVLKPIRTLRNSMREISQTNTSNPVPETKRKDEIGDMARTVEVFRNIIIERKNFEDSLIETRELAESSNRAKTEFLANMSHELRTPLNGIIGLSDLIRQATFGPLENEKYADYINEIYNSGTHLLALVKNILDVSEFDSGSVRLQESAINFGTLIDDCIRQTAADTKNKNITIRNQMATTGLTVRLDYKRIKQAFSSILSNAVKFTPEGGSISIDMFFEEDGAPAISITDTGIGMARDVIEEALAPFGQIERGTFARHEGVGLGLYLCRLLVEIHGGKLKIKSAKDSGTRITVLLPANRVIDTA
ncbi:MAG: ATP-binding protein [Alphaproteobacteria bacterium]